MKDLPYDRIIFHIFTSFRIQMRRFVYHIEETRIIQSDGDLKLYLFTDLWKVLSGPEFVASTNTMKNK